MSRITELTLDVVSHLLDRPFLAGDTETTGLDRFGKDYAFSIAVADDGGEWSFDIAAIQSGGNGVSRFLKRLISDTPRTWSFHNAAFDMAMLEKAGYPIHPESEVWDTASMARLMFNQEPELKLDYLCKKYLGRGKLNTVNEWLEANPGKTYADVPDEIMIPYETMDARLCYDLAMYQQARFYEIALETPIALPPIWNVVGVQKELTRTVYKMEKRGVRVDLDYCRDAADAMKGEMDAAAEDFYTLTGEPFKKSSKMFAKYLPNDMANVTEKGNLSFDKKVLKGIKSDVSETILKWSVAKAKLNYFRNFIKYADKNGILHAEINEARATTGRFSVTKPALQTLKKPDKNDAAEKYPVRRAIIPYLPDHLFIMADYEQQEMKLLLDYAEAMGLIREILNGKDVHQATADKAGISRDAAKAINFGIIYGMGIGALAEVLGKDVTEAEDLREAVLSGAPEIRSFIRRVTSKAKNTGRVTTWAGRIQRVPTVKGRDMEYVMLNHLIQGGSADMTKAAMVRADKHMPEGAHVVLTIHDEIVLDVKRSVAREAAEILKWSMESVYPFQHLPQIAEVSHSYISLADKVKGIPV